MIGGVWKIWGIWFGYFAATSECHRNSLNGEWRRQKPFGFCACWDLTCWCGAAERSKESILRWFAAANSWRKSCDLDSEKTSVTVRRRWGSNARQGENSRPLQFSVLFQHHLISSTDFCIGKLELIAFQYLSQIESKIQWNFQTYDKKTNL